MYNVSILDVVKISAGIVVLTVSSFKCGEAVGYAQKSLDDVKAMRKLKFEEAKANVVG